MKKCLVICLILPLIACGPSQQEKEKIAAVTCSIMGETRNMDRAIRVREINAARAKIGGEPFLRGDYVIKEAFEYGLCEELVLNVANYDERLGNLKDAKREQERIAAEKRAEEERIAAEKRVQEERIAGEKRAQEERIAVEKLAEEERIAAEKHTEEERIAAEKRADSQSGAPGGFGSACSESSREGDSPYKVVAKEVRTAEALQECDALIIPGGETTTIKIVRRIL